jgi:hypothetical protein
MLRKVKNSPGPKGNRIVADTVSLVLKPSGGCSILAGKKQPVFCQQFSGFHTFWCC